MMNRIWERANAISYRLAIGIKQKDTGRESRVLCIFVCGVG